MTTKTKVELLEEIEELKSDLEYKEDKLSSLSTDLNTFMERVKFSLAPVTVEDYKDFLNELIKDTRE